MKQSPTFTLLAEISASPTNPLPQAWRTHQLTAMWQALSALETAPTPTKNDWRVCSDCVNLMETLIGMGEVQDPDGLLMEAVTALAIAGKRAFVDGQTIRLSGTGMQAVRAILEGYSTVIDQLSARTMIRAHRLTEKRIRDIHSGKRRPHDVEVVSL